MITIGNKSNNKFVNSYNLCILKWLKKIQNNDELEYENLVNQNEDNLFLVSGTGNLNKMFLANHICAVLVS